MCNQIQIYLSLIASEQINELVWQPGSQIKPLTVFLLHHYAVASQRRYTWQKMACAPAAAGATSRSSGLFATALLRHE